jgi:hypothetical protein
MSEPQSRARPVLLALAVAAAILVAREAQYADVRYDRFHLPSFDGHMYVAMAEDPAFFTVAPWGYRILLPWLVSALPLPHPVAAFFWATLLGLTAAGVLLFLYLRHLGMGNGAALLGVAAFGASPPVGEVVRYQFLVEPLTVALELAFLLALEAGGGLPLLALLAILGALSKEFFLLLLPLVYLVRRTRVGDARAAFETLVAAAPALATIVSLRVFWTPHISPPLPELPWIGAALALERLRETWREWWTATLLFGLTPLAVLGALRARARPLALPAAYLFLAALLAPMFNPVAFFPADVRRLLLYALPAVLPLALIALDRVWRHAGPPAPPWHLRPAWSRAAALAAAALAIGPLLGVDRYRRLDLQGGSDALRALAVCRETLRTAREIEAGGEFVFDPSSGRFSQGVHDPSSLVDLRRVRWFLAAGWQSLAPGQSGDAVMEGGAASLVLPCLQPRDLEVVLTLRSEGATRVAVSVNDRRIDDLALAAGSHAHHLRVPRRYLFRGDNLLALRIDRQAAGGLRLQRLSVGTAPEARDP